MKNHLVSRANDYGIALLRIIVGLVFLAHGAQKLFVFGHAGVAGALAHIGIPLPGLSAWLVTLAELLGGLALLVGLFTRWAAVPLAFSMLVAIVAVHLQGGFFAPRGFEYPLTLLAATLALLLTGPGALALEHVIFPPRRQPAVEFRGSVALPKGA